MPINTYSINYIFTDLLPSSLYIIILSCMFVCFFPFVLGALCHLSNKRILVCFVCSSVTYLWSHKCQRTNASQGLRQYNISVLMPVGDFIGCLDLTLRPVLFLCSCWVDLITAMQYLPVYLRPPSLLCNVHRTQRQDWLLGLDLVTTSVMLCTGSLYNIA